ncbi:hypothetical protein K491DRAFT_334839 [Lophiostoma macrostomum CBS 122681]|uniref:Uncharacterized protein n=1 Tax=Lophiostoma macrostomum CBS 122681 TaxID=1314788 RepID=A0A6A6TQ51_9PLEO|nr:hypothetical protein K491DRAFT_334839 [Lophiostoma macrostomum CBS 122681]
MFRVCISRPHGNAALHIWAKTSGGLQYHLPNLQPSPYSSKRRAASHAVSLPFPFCGKSKLAAQRTASTRVEYGVSFLHCWAGPDWSCIGTGEAAGASLFARPRTPCIVHRNIQHAFQRSAGWRLERTLGGKWSLGVSVARWRCDALPQLTTISKTRIRRTYGLEGLCELSCIRSAALPRLSHCKGFGLT